MIFFTIEKGRTVKFPVFIAAGKVEDCVLKYPPNGQPSQQRLRNWQAVLPGIAALKFATRPINKWRLPLYCALILAATSFSTQFRSIGGKNCPSGKCNKPSFDPLMPAKVST